MTTTGKPLPRFERAGRGRGATEVVHAIAPTLLRLASKTEEAQRHANLVERFGQARTRLTALSTRLEEARRVDLAEERAAAETGRKRKPEKVPKVEEEIEEQRREVEVLSELIEESARDLLRAVIPYLAEADKQARAAVEAALVAARDALSAAAKQFEQAGALAGESNWIASLMREGKVRPWSSAAKGTSPTPRASAAVREAIVAYDNDLLLAAERVEHTERERQADEALKLRPGSLVWRAGESFIVGPNGELQEIEP
jgi:chromosome segregation ATPase